MIDPGTMKLQDWADQMSLFLERYGIAGRLLNEARWQEWATQVVALPRIAKYSPPQPQYYKDWRQWAYRFNQTVDFRQ